MILGKIKRSLPLASPTRTQLVGAIFIGAAMVRLVSFSFTLGDPYIESRVVDEALYHLWALQIAQGDWSRGASFFTTPLYAYFLGAVYSTGQQGILFVRFLNLLLGLGTLLLVYLSSRNYFEEKIAITTLILVGFCTAPIFYEWFPEKTALVLFLTSFSFYLFSRAAKSGNLALWLAVGVSIGVASLAHMAIFVMVPAGMVHLLVNRKGSWSGALRSALVLSAGFLLGVLPATIHNYLQDGDLVLVSSNGGQNFYTGNFKGNDTGLYTVAPFSEADLVSEELRFKAEAERRTQRTLKPSEVSRFWFREGWAEMRDLPGLSVRRIWRRLRWTLGATEVSDTRTYEFYQSRYRLLQVPFLGFGFISWLGMLGLLLSIGVRTNCVLSAFILLFSFELSLFFVYGRYRLPLIIPLGMFAAVALHRLTEFFRQRRAAPLLTSVLALAAVGWFVFGTVLPSMPTNFFPDYYNQGAAYLKLGMSDRADEEFEKALTVRPGNHPTIVPAYLFLADRFLASGQTARAVRLLRHGVARFPSNTKLLYKLSEALGSYR